MFAYCSHACTHTILTTCCFTHPAPPAPTTGDYTGRYPSANLWYNGTWYAGTYALKGGNRVLGPFVSFRTSTDDGVTWQQDSALTPTNSVSGLQV
jgi:hypothetical protein